MTAECLRDQLLAVMPETEVLVRIEPDLLADPQGCVFRIRSVEISAGGTEADSALLKCDERDELQELV